MMQMGLDSMTKSYHNKCHIMSQFKVSFLVGREQQTLDKQKKILQIWGRSTLFYLIILMNKHNIDILQLLILIILW